MAAKWEAEGDAIVAKTQQAQNATGWGISSWFGGGGDSKKEKAKDGYSQAANKYKLAKAWKKAADAMENSAKLHEELGELVEAGNAYLNAGELAMKDEDGEDRGVALMDCAVRVMQETGRLGKAGKTEKQIGEKLEARGRKTEALKHFQRAYDLYSADDSFRVSAISCIEKVAECLSEEHQFKEAFEKWQAMIEMCAEDTRLNQRIMKPIMNAFFCVITLKDSVRTSECIEQWADKAVRFSRSSEREFCEALNAAFEDGSYQDVSTQFTEWDRYHKLNDWQVSCIMIIFKELKGEDEPAPAPAPAPVRAPAPAPAPAPAAPAPVSEVSRGPAPTEEDFLSSFEPAPAPQPAPAPRNETREPEASGGWPGAGDSSSECEDDSVL